MTLETAEAYYNRGRRYFREREFILALADFNAAVSLNPYHGSEDYIDLRHLRGLAYYMVAVEKRNADYRIRVAEGESSGEADIRSRFSLSNDQLLNKALSDFTAVVGLAPSHYRAYHWRGQTLLAKMKTDHAIADYSRSISINASFPTAYFGRGNAYGEKGEYNRATSDFSAYIRMETYDKKYRGYYKRGRAYYLLGEYDRSLDDLEAALQMKSNYGEAYNLRQHIIQQWPHTRATDLKESERRPRAHGESYQEYTKRLMRTRHSDDLHTPGGYYYDSDPYDSMAVNYESEYGEGYDGGNYGEFAGEFW